MNIADDWLPTAANINALPAPLRAFIHELETVAQCDPAGLVAENIILRDQVREMAFALAGYLCVSDGGPANNEDA